MYNYWYYRRQTIETYGYSKIFIVCEKGKGLRNFKILSRNDGTIKVGYSIGPVRVFPYNMYYKGYTEAISQAYYILDVETGKIRRTQLIAANTVFPLAFKKTAVSFCSREEVEFKIISGEKEYAVKSYDKKTGEQSGAYNMKWLDIMSLPDTIFELDFETRQVQEVHVLTFLN